ncbi:GRAM domain-containing protein 2B-like isoform X2 [Electrophorus electricus]|uniref:GRAM domain-containing protein 2B-like isoform X2 n=1 Tax=Electrophorus electricus TaxID=8005 RepID=UPI0015CF9524|nr:GRAM domain-containing protein 2B-like isoform X2 [Electrophorus electricus]
MVLMIDQAERLQTALSSPEVVKSIRADRRDTRIQNNSEPDNGEERQRRGGTLPSQLGLDSVLSVDTESDLSESRKKPSLMRFKAVDQPSFLQSPLDCDSKAERKKSQYSQFSKANAQYHKLFKEMSKDEILKQSYTCALQKDILYQGRLFVSDNWICFHSKVFGRDTKIVIPVLSITLIKKTKTALLVPNALVITTTNERHVFVSFLSRDTTYKFLISVCVHLHRENVGSTPVTSSAENSFRGDCPSSLPLDFSADFSDLDGVVHQRRQDMLESSSSGSQTPDYEKMTEFQTLSENFLGTMKSGEMAVHADIHLPATTMKQHNALGPGKAASGTGQQEHFPRPLSLNTLLLVYLFLNAVHHHAQLEVNAEIYGELSTNLFKLEKIQRNLRKLLEEG